MKVENMEQYDKIAFSDWTNSLSKTPMLKAQHPEYETWTAGIHGRKQRDLYRLPCKSAERRRQTLHRP